MDLSAALKWLNAAVINTVGHALKEPELVILKGTWRGLTYEQMAVGSDYSTNYLMRDVAPKLWRQLSSVFGRSVGKTNFRVALEAYAAANANYVEFEQATPRSEQAILKKDVSKNTLRSVSGNAPRRVSEEVSSAARTAPSAIFKTALSSANLSSANLSSAASAPLYWQPAASEEARSETAKRLPQPSLSAASMYGYEAELEQVKRWMNEAGDARIVGIWGLKGVGKTLLAEKAVAQMGDRYEAVVWRSLQSQPPLESLCADILLSVGIEPAWQASAQLLALMNARSLIIVLDKVEAILRAGELAGDYAPNCQAYSAFFQAATG